MNVFDQTVKSRKSVTGMAGVVGILIVPHSDLRDAVAGNGDDVVESVGAGLRPLDVAGRDVQSAIDARRICRGTGI